jgi:hypothetical protein
MPVNRLKSVVLPVFGFPATAMWAVLARGCGCGCGSSVADESMVGVVVQVEFSPGRGISPVPFGSTLTQNGG